MGDILAEYDAMKMVKIELPEHAIRYLHKMCWRERQFLARAGDPMPYSLQNDATYDSLRAIEDALPPENARENSADAA